jgi:RHS repeat-associated protein
MVTGHEGYVWERHDYQPFGVEMPPVTGDESVRFAGKEHDEETGASNWMALDYFGARYLHSATGRFTSVDPITITEVRLLDPQQLNLYAYTRNNPLAFVDPDGRQSCPTDYCVEVRPNGPTEAQLVAEGEAGLMSLIAGRIQFERAQLPTFDDALKRASDFSAGVGDALTGRMIPGVHTSLTEYIRKGLGTDSVVAKDHVAYLAGEVTGGTVGWALVGSASATGAAVANGKYGALFGRGGKIGGGVVNRGLVRFGWYWNGARDAIGLRIGVKGSSLHIPFWYP